MGVLTEIGAMRCVVIVLFMWWGCCAGCPSLCSCRGGARADARPENAAGPSAAEVQPPSGEPLPTGEPLPPSEPLPPGEPLRLRCGGPPALISELKEIDFTDIQSSVISLNMSGNAISTLSRDLHLPNLQKLDLSRNQISLIESDAFYNISALQRLDLSHNQIAAVARDMFKGLARLERLLLAHNLLTALAPGTFAHLGALKQLDISENAWVCDCALVWVGGWLRAAGARLLGSARCAAPAALAGRAVRKLRVFLDLRACADPAPAPADAAPLLLRPAADQLVFAGDALTLTCSAPLASALHKYSLRWLHPLLETCDVNVTSVDVLDEGAAETAAFFPNVTAHHAGAWTCAYEDEARGRHNRTVRVTVLTDATRYCATSVTADNKGLYSWPQLLLNRTAAVPCRAGAPGALATRACGADGAWAAADTAACAYTSNVTKLLQQFAALDVALVPYGAVNASARLAALLRASTYPLALLDDPDDVMFVAQAVDNYMRYVDDEPDLGSALLDVISATMNVTAEVMAAAEARHGACSRLVRAAERLASRHTDKQKSNLAVESFPVAPGFGGATCAWYSSPAPASPATSPAAPASAPGPRLHCTTTNRTVARMLTFSAALIHASVQIPASLQYSLEPAADTAQTAPALVVGVWRSAALFPLAPGGGDTSGRATERRAKDLYGRNTRRDDLASMEVASPVVSVRLHNGNLSRALLEPIIATLRARGCGGGGGGGGAGASHARCAVWDSAAARWHHNSTECRVLHVAGCTWVVSLARPAVLALLARAERGFYGARTDGARFKVSHPAVYVGSLLLLACLACAATTYCAAWRAVAMPRREKHALVNTWLAQAALAALYTLGIYQTEDARLCRALGLALHYLSLCCLVWMCVHAHGVHEHVARRCRPPPPPPPPTPTPHEPKPVLGLYLCGWGVALIVCGISGAVNLDDYAGYAQCFLSTAAALAALFVPAALLLLLLAALFLLIRCGIRDNGGRLSEGTERLDLELWEPAGPGAGAGDERGEGERRSCAGESDAEDAEHAPLVRLRAAAAVLALHVAAWAAGAVAVYRPLPAYLPYQEDICSILYAVCATVLGTFTLFFYGIARSDVRAQWALMHCYLRRRKPCCRSRSVVDSARQSLPPRPATLAPHAPGDDRSRSGSRSSRRTNSKTDNGAVYKAGAELNGHTLSKDAKNTNGKAPNINLVVLHRQQYRSAGSVLTRADSAAAAAAATAAGADAFYNPNQMNVAKKFFKKQRQHVKRNRLELPPRRDRDDESHASLPLPAREPYADLVCSAKVNNTNIHVEPRADRGRTNDPNLLGEVADHKSYCTDRPARRAPPPERHVVNIYTNVPETLVPQHLVGRRALSAASADADTRTVSQQCSLDCSSASELAPSASEHTLDASERTTEPEPEPELSRADTTDADSFGQYVDHRPDLVDKSLQDISEECTMASDPEPPAAGPGDRDDLPPDIEPDDPPPPAAADGEEDSFAAATADDFETASANASEHESDIYCPNYQMSEVSIRSHGLYAPSPSSMCPNELGLSADDVSANDTHYVNWRGGGGGGGGGCGGGGGGAGGDGRDSRASGVSELDALYSAITARGGGGGGGGGGGSAAADALDATAHSDVTLRPDSDSSDADSHVRGGGGTLKGTLV